jgi:hypothetical protein
MVIMPLSWESEKGSVTWGKLADFLAGSNRFVCAFAGMEKGNYAMQRKVSIFLMSTFAKNLRNYSGTPPSVLLRRLLSTSGNYAPFLLLFHYFLAL